MFEGIEKKLSWWRYPSERDICVEMMESEGVLGIEGGEKSE